MAGAVTVATEAEPPRAGRAVACPQPLSRRVPGVAVARSALARDSKISGDENG